MSFLRNPWLRFAVWVVILVAIAAGAALAHLEVAAIIALMAASWLALAVADVTLARWFAQEGDRRPRRPPRRRPAPAPAAPPAAAVDVVLEGVRVLREPAPRVEPEPAPPAPEPVVAAAPEPEPEPESVPEAWPVFPDPVAVPEPVAVAVAAPAPEPVAVESEPEPEPLPVVAAALLPAEPQEWNLWTLDKLVRDSSEGEIDDERAFLLMYLREFANADGVLPRDFDALVRESFGELLVASAGR